MRSAQQSYQQAFHQSFRKQFKAGFVKSCAVRPGWTAFCTCTADDVAAHFSLTCHALSRLLVVIDRFGVWRRVKEIRGRVRRADRTEDPGRTYEVEAVGQIVGAHVGRS